MKTAAFILTALCLISSQALADDYVHGYARRDGTYVQPHYKTESNSTRYDNYSTRGNSNPYTGEKGYVDPTPSYGSYGRGNSYGSNNSYSSGSNSIYGNTGNRRSRY